MFSRRLAGIVLSLALAASNLGLCAGWQATPEARMACCSTMGNCPMHKSDSPSGSKGILTQADADRCCAVSEEGDSTPSAPGFSLSAPIALVANPVPSLEPAATVNLAAWGALASLPAAHVPKHLLLSVLLV